MKHIFALGMCSLLAACNESMIKHDIVTHSDANSVTVSSFPTEKRGIFIRKMGKYESVKEKVIVKDKDGNEELKEIERYYPAPGLIVCPEPPADTGANTTFAMNANLSNQLSANMDMVNKLTRELERSRESSQGDPANTQSIDGSSSTNRDNSLSSNTSNNSSIEASLNLSRNIVELGGRTQLVLLARDFLSSNCINAANGFISRNEFVEMQKLAINQIGKMLEASVTQAKAEETKAEAAKVVAETKQAELDKSILAASASIRYEIKVLRCERQKKACDKTNAGNTAGLNKCLKTFKSCIKI